MSRRRGLAKAGCIGLKLLALNFVASLAPVGGLAPGTAVPGLRHVREFK